MTNWGYEVGKQVVCIVDWTDHDYKKYAFPSHFIYPVYKGIYTIRVVGMQNDWGSTHQSLSLGLEEIMNVSRGIECLFHASGFRPVKETSIECFTKFLKKLPQEELL